MHHGGHDSNARKLDSNGAFLTFFKSFFGAGLLSLPNVFGRVGLILGVLVYTIVGIGCGFSCYLLVQARQVTKSRKHEHHLVTYGDLADLLFGSTMASVTRWTIIVLSILFTTGLVIVICENLAELLAEVNGGNEQEYRSLVGLFLLPIVTTLLQIPWLQDMWLISVMGLAVYTIGVIGSTLFSAVWTMLLSSSTPDTTVPLRGVPDDLWNLDWQGIPSFVGSAVYALEGINLALPTVHSMQVESDATWVVCASVFWYAAATMVFAAVGYAGGLGGGAGTGLTREECDLVTNCISPPFLQYTVQLTLSIAMTLSIPVMLYPSTEMLEVMLTDWHEEQEHPKQEIRLVELERLELQKGTTPASSVSRYGSTDSPTADNETLLLEKSRQDGREEKVFSQEKNWKLRVALALLTVTMGATTKSFTYFSGLIGAVGLSFAGFVLPPLLYLRAMEQAQLLLNWPMKAAMTTLAFFGVYNMIAGGASSFCDLRDSFS